jgi:U3 small nucleolar RNA-associated protein 23
MTFGFREPYQILGLSLRMPRDGFRSAKLTNFGPAVDAEMVKDANKFTMDLAPALERTVHGKVKPCEQRRL